MWSAALVFIKSLLDAVNLWQVGRQRDADRQSGKDEVFSRAQWEVIKRADIARAIERGNADDSLLTKPENRDK
jgi:hypothetical protein